MGYEAEHAGKEFESRVIHMADIYRKLKYAFIRKVNPKMIRKNKSFIYTQAEGYDFYGSIYRNQKYPTPVYFECKTTMKPEISILQPKDPNKAGITFKQISTLVELQANGDKAFVLWEIRSLQNKTLILNPKSLYLFVGKTLKLKDLHEGTQYETVRRSLPSLDFLNLLP